MPAVGQRSEAELLAALRAGDEDAFAALVDEHGAAMVRLARVYVRAHAVAEEVVQDAWLGALRGLDRFEGRSSLKTWLFRIVVNTAKTRAVREGRTVPLSDLGDDPAEPSVEPDRFAADRAWASPPAAWDTLPEAALLSSETRRVIEAAVERLPPRQQAVITLRDLQGWSSEEVRNALDLSETGQRVLLHRARSKVRQALEDYLTPT